MATEEFMDAGYEHINFVNVRGHGSSRTIISYGRASGQVETPLVREDLVEVIRTSDDFGELSIYAPSKDQVDFTQQSIGLRLESGPDFLQAAKTSLSESLKAMPLTYNLQPSLDVIAAPSQSGYSFQQRTAIEDKSIPIAFVISIDSDGALESIATWWQYTVDMVSHELLHLEHKLYGFDLEERAVDFEVAAYLIGQCAVSRFAQALGVNELRASIELPPDAFPGIEQSRFSPDLNRIRTIGNASRQGRTIAFAVMYHLYADETGGINLADPVSMQPMLEMCNSLSRHVPAYTQGEVL